MPKGTWNLEFFMCIMKIKKKMWIYLNKTKYQIIKYFGLSTLYICYKFDRLVRKTKLDNEQFFLDWQDKVNEISVK